MTNMPIIKKLKMVEAHLIITPGGELTPQIQVFFQDEDNMTHAIALPVTVFNSPTTIKGHA